MHARTRAPASGEEVPLEASGDESSARTVITPAVALLVHKLNLWASVQLWIMHALRVATGRPQRAPRQALRSLHTHTQPCHSPRRCGTRPW